MATKPRTPRPAAPSPEAGPRPDGWALWTLQPDGTIDVTIRGTVYSLAAPTIGQLRDIELAHAKSNAHLRANLDTLIAEAEKAEKSKTPTKVDPVALIEAKYARVDLWVSWWLGTVWPALGADVPARDDLPPWMLDPNNVLAALVHWQSTPPVPGGG